MNRLKLLFLRLNNGVQLKYSVGDIFRLVLFRKITSKLHRHNRHPTPLTRVDISEVKITVVSLHHRNDRRKTFEERIKSTGLQFSFIDGVSIREEVRSVEAHCKCSIQCWKHLSRGSIGCILAHFKAVESSLSSTHNYFIIFEDDVVFFSSFKEKLINLLNHLPRNFDIIYLGSGNKIVSNLRAWATPNLYVPLYPRIGQYAYLISRSGAEKIASNLFPINIVLGGIDTIIGRLVSQKKLTAYHVYPPICSADIATHSDIVNPSLPRKSLYNFK